MSVRKSYRLLAFVAVVGALAAGVLLLGRISDNASVAMRVAALWFGLVFAAAAVIVLRRRALFWPLALGYGLVAVAAAVLVIAPTLFDIGNQQYDLSGGVNLRRYSTVVVGCRAFSVAFTSASLN